MKGNNAEQFRRGSFDFSPYQKRERIRLSLRLLTASQMYKTVEEFPKPVIAVINGTCCGEGNGLAMACDIGIAAKEDITFNLSEVKIGLIPAIISRFVSFIYNVFDTRLTVYWYFCLDILFQNGE